MVVDDHSNNGQNIITLKIAGIKCENVEDVPNTWWVDTFKWLYI